MARKRLVLGLLWITFFTAYLDRTNITIAGPTLMQALTMSPQTFGFVLGAFTAGYALMQMPGGALADRFGSRPLLVAALLGWSVFTALTGFARSATALIAVRFGFGIGEGLENGAHFKALADGFSPAERSTSNAIFHTALALGPAAVAPSAAYLLQTVGWRELFVLFAIQGLVVAAIVWAFFPARVTPAGVAAMRERPNLRLALAELRHPSLASAFAAYAFFNVAFWGFLGWMPTYLNHTRHIVLASLGFAAALPYLAGCAGLLAAGALGSTILYGHRAELVAVSYAGAAAGLYIAFTVAGVAASLTGLCIAGFFLFSGFGPFWAVTMDLVPEAARGVLTGFVSLGGQVGGFFAPIVVGIIYGTTKSFTGAFIFMIVALSLAASCMLLIPRFANRDAIAEHAVI